MKRSKYLIKYHYKRIIRELQRTGNVEFVYDDYWLCITHYKDTEYCIYNFNTFGHYNNMIEEFIYNYSGKFEFSKVKVLIYLHLKTYVFKNK